MEKKRLSLQTVLSGLPAGLLCLFLLGMTALNIRLPWRELKSCATKTGIDLTGLTDRIADAFQSDELTGKNAFVNLNGLFARASGQMECNGVQRLRNGMLTEYSVSWNMNPQAEALTALSQSLRKRDIPFTFILAPTKMDLGQGLLPAFWEDHGNENADALVTALRDNKVSVLDLRAVLAPNAQAVETYFYKTDHHWNANGAFVAFEKIMERLKNMAPGKVDGKYADKALWTEHTVPELFLGSWGKRVGAFFGGVDDLIYLTPDFDTDLSLLIPNHQEIRTGDFEQVCLWQEYAGDRDLFGKNNYFIYMGGDYPVLELRNRKAPNSQRLLIVEDSFSAPLLAFLQTEFAWIDAIDPRYYDDGTIMDYITMNPPDAVLMMLNPRTLGNWDYFNNLGCQEAEADQSRPKKTGALRAHKEFTLTASNNEYNSLKLAENLRPGRVYALSFTSAEALTGDLTGLMAAVYDTESRRFALRKLWDPAFEEANGGYRWVFRVPESWEGKQLELLLYSGVSGSAQGIGVKFHDLLVEETKYQ